MSRNISLVQVSRVFLAVLGLSAVLLVGFGAANFMAMRSGFTAWDEYRATNDPVRQLQRRLVETLGYGAFIHHFKDYILTGDRDTYDAGLRYGGASLTMLEQLGQTVSGDPDAVAQVETVRAVVMAYLGKLASARQQHAIGNTPEAIDDQINIDDGPALEALAALTGPELDLSSEEPIMKAELLMQLGRILGYGGVIHEFKDFVIRHDPSRYDSILAQLAKLDATLERYRNTVTRAEEIEALNELKELSATIRAGADLVSETIENDPDVRAVAIDEAVRWSDDAAIAALGQLERAIALDSFRASDLVDSKLASTERRTLVMAIAVFLVLSGIALIFNVFLRRVAVVPARSVADAIQRLASGDTSVDMAALESDTEIGRIAVAGRSFRQTLLDNKEMSTRAHEDATAQRQLAEDSKRHADEVSALMARQAGVQSKVSEHAEKIRREVTTISESAWNLSKRNEQQASTLEEGSESLKILTASVETVAESAGSAREEMKEVAEVTQSSLAVVNDAVGVMERIVASSEQISQVTGLIDDISFQTNLLALNAGVEAARAGEAGRGFAVVASEVRALAQRSADAASSIKDLISNNTGETRSGSEKIERAGDSIGEIANLVAKVLERVEQVAGSAREQSDGLRDLNGSIQQLDEVAKMNTAMFEETAASTTALSKMVDALIDATEVPRQGGADFGDGRRRDGLAA